MKSVLKNVFRQCYRKMLEFLPIKVALNIENFRGYHRLVNFKNPKYFGEKIQWLKLNGSLEKYGDFVDKYKVRQFVEKTIGKDYLINILGVFDSPNEIEYDTLPNKFVIKLNTGSGYNILVDKSKKFDVQKTNKMLKKWLAEDYYKMKKEPQYKNVEKKIIIEEYLSDNSGELLDYKFFCFDGQPRFLKVDYDRYGSHKVNFYDLSWNLLELREGDFKTTDSIIEKPKNFDRMIGVVKKLCKRFQFVRVDLYNVDGKIYFGELTFTPAAGVNPFKPLEKDLEIADMIKLPKKNNVLYIGSVGEKTGRLDGVTVKSKCLLDFLKKQHINLFFVDVDNYKKHPFTIIMKILKNYSKCDSIVICSSSPGASILLSFLRLINSNKDIYYFVAGGVLGDYIKSGKYNIKNYINLKAIYVESNFMLKQLNDLGLKNVIKLNNFRFISNYVDNYENTNEFKFVFWARVIKEKGIEDAIDVVIRLNRNTSKKIILDIYGQCNKDYLNFLSKKFGNYIRYFGAITPDGKSEYEILSKYDVLLFPTHYFNEGLPGTIIDAYVSKLAVVSANWKYAAEYIEDKKNGYIYEFGNVEDFYLQCLKILNNDNIKKFKEHSYKLSKKYDVNYVLKEFIDVLTK